MRLIYWLVPILCLASYLVLILWLAPQLSAQSGGAIPFDLRIGGYALAEAQAYLAGLTPEGRAIYLGPIRVNDTVFPLLFTLTLILPLWARVRDRPIWALPALGYGLLDLGENWAVARLLRADAVTEAQVALASGLTIAKFAFVALAILLAIWGLWDARRRAR